MNDPKLIVNKLIIATITNVWVGRINLKGSSKNNKNWEVRLMAMNNPIKNPKIMELRLFAIDSYTVTLIISFFVIPIDLNTPNSHIESLMLAEIVTIN